MKYTRVRIEFEKFEDRLNRTFLVKGNPDLFIFASFLAFIINSKFCHCYEIITDDSEYVMASFMENPLDKYLKHMKKYRFNDLPSRFKFLYDTGENYLFKCYKEDVVDINSNQNFFIESAKGQGIWEDNISSLIKYLEGKIDPNSDGSDLDEFYSLPWNFNNKCFKDFDNEVDIEKFKDDYSKHFSSILSKVRKEDEEIIAYYHMTLEDIEPNYEYVERIKRVIETELINNKNK